jgi:Concanavalin A-like lectin/glucanases superfamily
VSHFSWKARQIEQISNAQSATFTDSSSVVDSFSPTSAVTGTDNLDGYRATILGDNPICYYRLDETSGSTAYDSTPNARNGTISSGVTLSQVGGIAGDTDTAMSFARASSGHITLPQSGLPTGSSQWSVEAWCCPTTTTGGYYMIAGFGTYTTHEMAVIGINGGTLLSTYSGDIGGPTVKVNTWYHVVGTFDGTNINLYTNGTLSAHTAEVPNIVLNFANIGAGSGADYFNGIIDEVAIYSYALSATQVAAHYAAGTSFTNETLQMAGVPSLVDTGSLLDTVSATEKATLSESGASLVDTSNNVPVFNGADTLATGPGQLSESITASLTDLASLTDALSLALTEGFADASSLQDRLANISVSTLKDALSLVDSYAASELLSMIDQSPFSDKLIILPEDIQLIIQMITTCRNGLATTSSRSGTTTTSSRNGAFIPLSFLS